MSGSELFGHGDKVQWNSEPNVPATPDPRDAELERLGALVNKVTDAMDERFERLALKKIEFDMVSKFLEMEEDAETVLSMTTPIEIEPNVYKSDVHFEEFERVGANTYEVYFVYNIITGKGVIE